MKLTFRKIIVVSLIICLIAVIGIVIIKKVGFYTSNSTQIVTSSPAVVIINGDDFIQYLKNFASKKSITDYWATTDCISYEANEISYEIQVDIYEKHGSGCAGDPNTSPRTATFIYDKTTQQIYWNDVVRNNYRIPFKEYVQRYARK